MEQTYEGVTSLECSRSICVNSATYHAGVPGWSSKGVHRPPLPSGQSDRAPSVTLVAAVIPTRLKSPAALNSRLATGLDS